MMIMIEPEGITERCDDDDITYVNMTNLTQTLATRGCHTQFMTSHVKTDVALHPSLPNTKPLLSILQSK